MLITRAFSLCGNGTYGYLDGTCRPYLTCANLRDSVEIVRPMSGGHVKRQFLGKVDEMFVVYSTHVEPWLHEDFMHGLQMLVAFQESEYVSRLIGYCDDESDLMVGSLITYCKCIGEE